MTSSEDFEANGSSGQRVSHATIACPNCGIHQSVEVDYDDGQGRVFLPTTPCSVCHQHLCCFCEQFTCECGQIVCPDCALTVPDGTPSGLRLCFPCARQADPLCPNCGEFAHMIPQQNSEQQWFECSACGAAMDGDEIEAANSVPLPRCQPGTAQQRARKLVA